MNTKEWNTWLCEMVTFMLALLRMKKKNGLLLFFFALKIQATCILQSNCHHILRERYGYVPYRLYRTSDNTHCPFQT